ncbi:ABC transporter permease [Bifidobacterium sp. UTBIF-78]|uniref:ABC transporter permease n=1 Tax=Bifidobacterium sp. UTBIF-78 TaxID=1465263 RepID=UPI001125EF44|nr:FtsX-like permease family protein [Bifidobacterium sp. UTBIF-78]TPF95950.1 ABC transporter permease [Bifidobacterium sp. UTBIF-78]
MFDITLKLMRKNGRMLIPAGIAILIGTAFIAATFLFSNTMGDALVHQQTALYGGANYVVTPDSEALKNATEDEQSKAYATTVADFQLDRLRTIDGVEDVRVDVTVPRLTVAKGDRHVTGIAIGTAKSLSLLPVTVSDGNQPIDNDEIALPRSVAEQLGVSVGDTVTVNSLAAQAAIEGNAAGAGASAGEFSTAGGATTGSGANSSAMTVRVTGLTDDPNGAYSYYGGASVLSNNVLATMSGAAEFNDVTANTLYLDLAGAGAGRDGDAKAQATAERVAKLMPEYYVVMSRADIDKDALQNLDADGGLSITTVFLLSFGILAMVVAALVIANTFQVLVAQRRRTLALLRTIGAQKGQLYASVLLEAGVLGLVASLLGVALGIGLIAGLCASGLMGGDELRARLILSWQAFVVPIAFGVVMTVLASLGSARAATAVTPLEALRPIELTDTRRAGVMRAVCSGILVAAGAALAVFAAWQMHESLVGHDALIERYAVVLLMAIAGCALIFLGLVLSAAFWLPLLMRGVGSAVSLAGPSARIANANIQKNPRRVAATGAALLIGVTLVSTIATGAASGKQTMEVALDQRYSVDMIAAGNDMTDKQATDAAEAKGMAASLYAPTTVRYVTTKDGKELSVMLVGIKDAAALAKVMKADLSGVSIGPGDVLLPTINAMDGKKVGFDGSVVFRENPAGVETDAASRKPIALKPQQADYRRVSSDYGAVAFVNAEHFTDGDLETAGHMLLMRVDTDAAGITMNDVLTNVQQAFSASPGVSVSGPVAERSMWETTIDSMMALLVGLIAVAVLIALVGVANTLSLSVIERTRESATLRAIGMTRGQLRRSLAAEALLLSLVSGVAGVALGTLFGWLGSYMVFSLYATVALPFDWATNGLVLGVAALAALLASVAPARRAVKVPPVEALAEA